MVSRWDKTINNLCPDYGIRETAAHLMICPGHSWTLLLKEQVSELESWMNKNDTDNEIPFWIPTYILQRNTLALSSFANLAAKLKLFAAEQYAIGWRGFTEGRISMTLINVQREHLNAARDRMNIR